MKSSSDLPKSIQDKKLCQEFSSTRSYNYIKNSFNNKEELWQNVQCVTQKKVKEFVNL